MFPLLLILAVSPRHFIFLCSYTIKSLSDFKINTKQNIHTHIRVRNKVSELKRYMK